MDVNLTTPVPGVDELPREFQPKTLRRRAVQALIALAVLFGVVLFAPGLGEVRDRLGEADAGWLALAAALEGLSGVSGAKA